MNHDPLQQYAKLKQQLTEEKSRLETRLNAINEVLGGETMTLQSPHSTVSEKAAPTRGPGRGRGARGSNTMSLRDAVLKALSSGPLARKDLAKAVEGVGYKFATKNPLNSIGSVLYAKDTPVKSKNGKFFLEGGAGMNGGSYSGNGTKAGAPRQIKKKRTLSPEGRARIIAATKARWAKQKAKK